MPSQVIIEKCCSQECLKKLSLEQLNKARDNFCKENPTYELQRKMILNWFDNNQPEIGKFVYTISGISVCWSAWTMTLGITRRTFYNLKADYLKGRRCEKHGSFGNIPRSEELIKQYTILRSTSKRRVIIYQIHLAGTCLHQQKERTSTMTCVELCLQ